MIPFSAMYYIRRNLKRTVSLILLLALTAVSYIGYLYFDSIRVDTERMADSINDIAFLTTYSDDVQFETVINEAKAFDSVSDVYATNSINLHNTTVIGINVSVSLQIFLNEKDAKSFNDVVEYVPNDKLPKQGEFVMSTAMAKNLGYSDGDKIVDSEISEYSIKDELTVKTFESDKFLGFGVNSKGVDEVNTYYIAVRAKGNREDICQSFYSDMEKLILKYFNKGINILTYDFVNQEIQNIADMVMTIYMGVVVFVVIILIFAVNAIFSAVYERRRYEFSVYKAIGMSRRETSAKIIKEILIMDVIGFFTGMIIDILVLFIVNVSYLDDLSIGLPYLSAEAFIIALISNVLVIIPIIILKIRKMRKYDITEF